MSRSAWGVLAAVLGSAGCLLIALAVAVVVIAAAVLAFVLWLLLTATFGAVQSAAAALAAWDALLSAAFGPTWWMSRDFARWVWAVTSAGSTSPGG